MTASDQTSQLQRKRALERHFAADFGTLVYPLLANTYYQEGDMLRARKVCRIGLKHHPEHAPGLFLLALVNMREGRMEEAEQLLDRTLAQDPYHVEAAEYFVAVQERLKRPPGVLERAYKILLLANPLSHSARVRLKRMQAEKELVLKVKREMRLREAAAREPTRVASREPEGELRPLPEVERPAKMTGAAESEPAPFVPTARLPEEPPLDILSDEEAERAERIGARLEESDQLTEAERAWERRIKEVAAELAQGEQVPEAIAGPGSTRFPLEDHGTGESEPVITTTIPEAEQPAEQAAPGEEGIAAVPAGDSEEAIAPAPTEESLIAAETTVEEAPEPLEEQLWLGEEDEAVEVETWPGEEQAEEPIEEVTAAEEAESTKPTADSGETATPAPTDDSLTAAETAVEETSAPADEQLWPGEEDEAVELESWPETTAAAETAGESTGADSAEITSEATPTVVEEPTLEPEPEAEPEKEIVAAAEPPETEEAGDELEPDFLEELPPGEEPETAKVAPEGGDEEEDTWATYLKPENVVGDNSLTVEAEISAEGEGPSVAAALGDLENELTTEIDAGETEPVPVEPEPAAEPEIEPATQPGQPGVPADDEPPSLSIAARLAQMRVELSAKYAPKESSSPAAQKAESKPEAQETPAPLEVQGEEISGDTEMDPVAEVEAEMQASGAEAAEVTEDAGDDQPAPIEPPEVAEELAEEQSTAESKIEEDRSADDGQPAEEASKPPDEQSGSPTDTTAAMYVDPKLATFTLVAIYQVQGLYQQALQVLDILESKGGDPERIKRERSTITTAMSTGSKSE